MSAAVLRFPGALLRRRELLARLTQREVLGRYRGSFLGFGWSLAQPLVMLAVYTFVFSTVFGSRWSGLEEQGHAGFAINLFAGLIVFNLFAECLNAAPGLILANPNYVTKVIFPLELLGAATLGAATVHACASLLVLALFQLAVRHSLPITLLWLPLVWLPLLLGCLGLVWIVSALGVYVRDLTQLMPALVTVTLFLSAVFYPLTALPPSWQPLMQANPLAQVIDQTRQVAVLGHPPNPLYLLGGTLLGLLTCELGYRLFRRAGKGFADVL